MSRPIRLQGETENQLATLKEQCEMEGSRMVSLRADELLGLVIVLTSSPAGLDVEVLGGESPVDPEVLEAQIKAAVDAALTEAKSKSDAMLSAAAEKEHDLVEANTKLVLDINDLKAKLDAEGHGVIAIADERDDLRIKLKAAEDAKTSLEWDLRNRQAVLEEEQHQKANQANTIIELQAKVAELGPQLDGANSAIELLKQDAAKILASRDEAIAAHKGEVDRRVALEAKVTELEAKLAPFQAALAAAATPKPPESPPATPAPAP
jgi:chromosome segregation ATPase